MEEKAIVLGGKETTLFPSCVALLNESLVICSGVVIAPNIVLSAAHCSQKRSSFKKIFIGANVNLSGEIVNIKKAYLHDYYVESTLENDLQILILEQPVISATPCKIASSKFIEKASQATIVGYGTNRSDSLIGIGIKRQALMSLEINSSLYGCNKDLEILALPVSKSNIADGCLCDSGGPLYIKANNECLLAGILSRNVNTGKPAKCGEGSIYLRLDRYIDWILSIPEIKEKR